MKQFVDRMTLLGDSQLMPERAEQTAINMWMNWRCDFEELMPQAKPFIETETAVTTLSLIFRMDQQNIHINVFDSEGNFGKPHFIDCEIKLSDLGADNVTSYAMYRSYSGTNAVKADMLRTQTHNSMNEVFAQKIAQAGLLFGEKEYASEAIHSLTAYWFDLLDSRGDLVVRKAARKPKTSLGEPPIS